MEEVEGYGGDKELIAKFGLESREEVNFVVARRRWENLISIDSNLIVSTRPNEGDLIYFPRIQKMFQIDFVDHDDPFYQVDNLPVYKLSCSTFEYSHEDFDTDITVIDNIETNTSLDALAYQITLEQAGTFNENMSLEDGYLLMQEDGTTGAGLGDNLLSETDTHGGNLITEYGDYIVSEEYVVQTMDENAKNKWIETKADAVLDFTERNPFGDPGGN
jgi:hypothetical protein